MMVAAVNARVTGGIEATNCSGAVERTAMGLDGVGVLYRTFEERVLKTTKGSEDASDEAMGDSDGREREDTVAGDVKSVGPGAQRSSVGCV